MAGRLLKFLGAVLLALSLASLPACKDAGVRETLDENTFISVISADPPLTFFRLRLDGQFERELVSVGIVERIASAERDTYLWINLWATRSDGSIGTVALADEVTFQTSAGDFTLTRTADDHRALGLSKAPYTVIRRGPGEGYFRTDIDNIAIIDGDSSLSMMIGDNRYELWGDQARAFDALARYLKETRY